MKVRIGYGLGTGAFDAGEFGALVDGLEELAFDSLWLSERLTGPALDPMTGLAVAAGRTRKLKLGTSVMVLPGRNPVELAKAWATLDRLSGGRALPAFGLGTRDAAEHEAFGVTRDSRAAIFDEALPLVRRLWTEDCVTHEGAHFVLHDVNLRPKPVQQPPDVWMGGRAPSELRRVGRLADGWLPSFCTPQEAAAGRTRVEQSASDAGRTIDPEHWGALILYSPGPLPEAFARALGERRPDRDPAAVVPIGPDAVRARLAEFVEHGFSKLVVVPAGQEAPASAGLPVLAEAVLDLQRTAQP